MFVTVTVTPGSAAPVVSRTVPSMLPLAACACATAAGTASAQADTNSDRLEMLPIPIGPPDMAQRRSSAARNNRHIQKFVYNVR